MDIYFTQEWGIVNTHIEEGRPEVYEYRTDFECKRNQFILREIPIKIDGVQYYDITAPYGYGGPYIIYCEPGYKARLIDSFGQGIQSYCSEHNIVSEFVRFHPIIENHKEFGALYEMVYMRKVTGTNLVEHDNPMQMEFSKSCRKNIRQALNRGITYWVTEKPDSLESFQRIYYHTMERNQTTGFYFFNDAYFEKCLTYFRENILLIEAFYEGKVIAAGLYLISGKTVHVHLTGTRSEYMCFPPEYVLRYTCLKSSFLKNRV